MLCIRLAVLALGGDGAISARWYRVFDDFFGGGGGDCVRASLSASPVGRVQVAMESFAASQRPGIWWAEKGGRDLFFSLCKRLWTASKGLDSASETKVD